MPILIFGFSLIELMIVITILGILSVIAIPSYQNYTKRARFAEVIAATEPFKISVALAMQEGVAKEQLKNGLNGIPDNPKPTKNLASIQVENGKITATGSQLTDNTTYILTAETEDGSSWSIDSNSTCIKNGLCHA